MLFALSTLLLSGFTAGASSGGYATVQDEGSSLTARTVLNFTGAGVSCVDSGGKTVCTIGGGGGGGSINQVEATLALDGAGVYSVAVTGQTWVTSSSRINCTPFGTTVDGLTPEAVAAAALDVSWASPVAGTGFTIWVNSPNGLAGTVRIHCQGV